jgi:nicotinamidase-related amidase
MGRLIDAGDCVLVLVDVQEGFLKRVEPEAKAGLIERIAFLTLSARFCGIPVVATVESPEDWGGLHPGLVEAVGDAPVIDKTVFGLAGDPLAGPAVREAGRGTAVLAGLETDVCVAQSALGLLDEGLSVVVVEDAVCLTRQRARGGHRADAQVRRRRGAHQAAPLRVDAHGQPLARVRRRPPRAGAAARRRALDRRPRPPSAVPLEQVQYVGVDGVVGVAVPGGVAHVREQVKLGARDHLGHLLAVLRRRLHVLREGDHVHGHPHRRQLARWS